MSGVDWYEVLGVPADAGTDEIRSAWKTAVADLDPTAPSFRVFNQAAEVLLDPARRAAYDESRAAELAAEEAEPETASVAAAPAAAAVTATPAAAAPDAETAGVETTTAPRGGVVLPAVLGVLAVLVLLLGWLAGPDIGEALAGEDDVLGVSLADDPGLTAVQLDEAQDAARAAVPVALSYDYRRLDEDEAATMALMTEKFGTVYAPWFAYLKTQALPNKMTLTATVLATAVADLGEEKGEPFVDFLVFFNQHETNKGSAQPTPQAAQATLRMVEQDGTWLIDGIELNQPETEPGAGTSPEPKPSAER